MQPILWRIAGGVCLVLGLGLLVVVLREVLHGRWLSAARGVALSGWFIVGVTVCRYKAANAPTPAPLKQGHWGLTVLFIMLTLVTIAFGA